MEKNFYTAVKDRRTIYGIGKENIVPYEKIEEIVKYAALHTPTAFNSQNGRVVILLGEHHDRLWDITKNILRKKVGEAKFPRTEEKLNSFQSGYGTLLFFEDMSIVEKLQNDFPTYKDTFPVWSSQAIGILQYIVWTSLEIEGLGASLQHYNPLIDDDVKKEWNIPDSWKLISQMPFGCLTAPPSEKQFAPLEERVKAFK